MLPHFGPYAKQREAILQSERLHPTSTNGQPVASDYRTGHSEPVTHVPTIHDLIGQALPKIGAYKQLDNTKQVVALINDVSVNLIKT